MYWFKLVFKLFYYYRFFKAVNAKEGKLRMRRKGFQLEEADLIGLDYLWRVICECSEDIAMCGVELMREVCSNPCSRLTAADYYEAFATDCCERLRAAHQVLATVSSTDRMNIIYIIFNRVFRWFNVFVIHLEAVACCVRLCRVLRVITEYVVECDRRYTSDRQILPLYRYVFNNIDNVDVMINQQLCDFSELDEAGNVILL